jgi:hypothetical protein
MNPDDMVKLGVSEANCLIGHEFDQRSKTPAFKSVPVRLTVVGNL